MSEDECWERIHALEKRIETFQENVASLQVMLMARKEIQRQKFERISSMLREVIIVLEGYIKD